jgi:hypothetical protein
MSDPYLKSDESIILTTDRVIINYLQYEVLLTSRHLILVDIRYDQFLPQKIPLSTILSVKGGKIATGEPVITLIFSDSDSISGSGPMTFIFTQQPGEQRKRERDEWLKNLMALIVSVRQETITTGSITADVEHGIRPSSRRPGAHEKISPYTKTVDTPQAPIELTIIPDEPESLVIPEEDQKLTCKPILGEESKPEVNYKTTEGGTNPSVSGEESGSSDTIQPHEPSEIVEYRPMQKDEEKLADTAITEVSSVREIPAEPETNSLAEKPFTLIIHEAMKSLLSSEEKQEWPEAKTSSESSGVETEAPLQEEPESFEMPTVPEPADVKLPTVVKEDSELSGTVPSKAVDIEEPRQAPSEQSLPPIPKSPPNTEVTGSQHQTLIVVTTIILIILGVGVGAVFYSQNFATPTNESVAIPPSYQQQTPVQQMTVQQTQVPQAQGQQTSAPNLVVIPPDGTWVRVVYTGNYYGTVGNPGLLQRVNGSGDQIYNIRKSDGLVQLQINKNDNSGNPLTVEIYRNGTLVTRQARSAPMGSIVLLIDAKTGNPPGVASVVTIETNQSGSIGDQVLYF